jgi:hypothetical protein
MLYNRNKSSVHFVGASAAEAVRAYLPVLTICSLLQVIGLLNLNSTSICRR